MTTCPSCKYSVRPGVLRCANCGRSFDETSDATAFLPGADDKPPSIHSTESADGARFAAGTMLAGRYRIVNLLGRGGMGEVYKAEDLKLKQIVALKFLPDALTLDSAALARFHNEVRITRQISHPNVCRVYDIAEAEGKHFLSMEYIDGEDLSVLLRRIGRLPSDKATEIARQICAGLAAAHDNGVLHRDLKPANIMIDGRGKGRVTDFGVAVVAQQLRGAEAASGTAGYMAPEQLRGEEVTQRSDIYSLGLVLYELFTGKRVYESNDVVELLKLHEQSAPTSPSSHIKNMDPLVERVILRCLEKDPKKRPDSAIQVAAALPGGDPLAAALAAGETPSPEMVAASGEKTGLRPAVAVGLLGAIIAVLICNILIGRMVDWPANLLRENSPDALTRKAQDIVQRLGYIEKPVDSAWGLELDQDHRESIRQTTRTGTRWNRAHTEEPAALYFWYRQSPRYLEASLPQNFGWIMENDPPNNDVAGMISMRLDPGGRLTYFKAVTRQVETPGDKPQQVEWTPLFAAAGLDPAAFAPAESTWMPEAGFDTRTAWTGTYPDQPDIPIRLEMATNKGKPVYFNLIAPWQRPVMDEEFLQSEGQNAATGIVLLILLGSLVGALLLARRNLSKGRGDRRGATRLALIVFAGVMLAWVFGADHRLTFNEANRFVMIATCQSLFAGGIVWLFYLALEPYVRRRWPETIISWSRALSGRVRDPLVGKDVLIAVLAGVVFNMMIKMLSLILFSVGGSPLRPNLMESWLGTRQFIASGVFANSSNAISGALFTFLVIFLLLVLTRRRWLTIPLFALLISVTRIGQSDPTVAVPFAFVFFTLVATVSLRLGLLVIAVAMFVSDLQLTNNFSSWYLSHMIAAHLMVLGLAGWAFHTSLGGQKLFTGSLLED